MGSFDGWILVGKLPLPITGTGSPSQLGLGGRSMSLSAFWMSRGEAFFDSWRFITKLPLARSRVERHGVLKAPRGFHDAEGLFFSEC